MAKRGGGQAPLVEADFSKGMVRDAPRVAIPHPGVYDSADFLLHEPGLAMKRGGTSYAGPALGAAAYARSVVYAEFPSPGSKLVAGTDTTGGFALYNVTAGAATALGGAGSSCIDIPKLRIGGGKNLLVFPADDGVSAAIKYDGTNPPAVLAGSPPGGKYCAIYKTRLVLGSSSVNPNRLYFSPTPDIEATWDTTNSWIDCDYAITGIAALHNALLIFSQGHTERIIGATPPPNSDMDRSPVGSIGCTDARSIVVQEGNCLFANPRGVYLTNGAGFASLTTEGGIATYWQSLFAGYSYPAWTISAGVYREYYFVSVLDNNGAIVASLMCNVPRRAWWRLTNVAPVMFSQAVGTQEELYYADRASGRVLKLSGIFSPSSTNKNDANGTAVTPLLELRAVGDGPGIKSYGFGRVSYTMTDAATDNPTLALTVKTGVRASTSSTPSESPLAKNTDVERKRFSVFRDAQAVTVKLAQANASATTEIYALEVEARPHPMTSDGTGG